MQYKLLDTGQGILTDNTSIFCDINGSCELPFLMPSEGRYVGIFTERRGVQLKEEFKENILKVPKAFLAPGIYQLQVIKIDDSGKVLKTWNCEPLKILSLDRSLKTEFEITGAATEEDTREILRDTLTELNKTRNDFRALTELLNGFLNKADFELFKDGIRQQFEEIINKFDELSKEVEELKGE